MTEVAEQWTPERCAEYVNEPLREGAAKFIEAGHRLHEAKRRVRHGEWMNAVALMSINQTTANTLMKLVKRTEISDNVTNLPSDVMTLGSLASLPEGKITELVESGEITAQTTRAEARKLVKVVKGDVEKPKATELQPEPESATPELEESGKRLGPGDVVDMLTALKEVKPRVLEAALVSIGDRDLINLFMKTTISALERIGV
jgi:DUF3102 family protein